MYFAIARSKNFNLKRKFKHRSNNQIKKKHYKTYYPTAFPTWKHNTAYPSNYPTTSLVNYDIRCSPKFCKEWSDISWCKCFDVNDTYLYEYYGCPDDGSAILC